jgi:CHRD domain/PEP-CTERM motif
MTRLFSLVVLAVAMAGVTRGSHAGAIVYIAHLDGPSESPPNASPGTGSAEVDFDIVAHSMHVQASFSGLLGTTTASHIHAATATPGTGTAGVATQVPYFTGFPIGVTSGTYDHTFDTSLASTYNPAFVTANGGTAASAEAALAAALAAGTAYYNIHTTVDPGGEIRGFLSAVPEPASISLMGVGTLALLFAARKVRK